ncbi:teichoic acid transporter [uncultured Adlercreutzia sp.]|uniref:teichoic acid transporter n=1 Tax=uncultured Adlercreutzia sp. TaxID=875803 RepID=UPI0025CC7BBA|nr:teichoic acid transporter [uncultured Adlercreutzia sp.]
MTQPSEQPSLDPSIEEASPNTVAETSERPRRGASHARGGHEAQPRARRSFTSLFHREKSQVTIGDVRYYDGAELSRPLEMPSRVRLVMYGAMAVAALLGALFLVNYFDGIMNEPLRQQQTLQENLTREVALDLPSLASLMPRSDEKIMAALSKKDYTLYERTPIGTDPDGGFEVIKLPEGVSLEEAGAMYLQGVDKLSAPDAVKLLKGAWTLTVTRKNGTSMRLRYADFDSGTLEKAVQNAMAAEGLENATVEDSGVDDSGNTYQTGTVTDKKDRTYTWRVSVIELSEVYDISGLPNTAYFVGIRFSA